MVAGPRVVGSALYMFRSHFGSRYKLGCCGHAGLFVAPCVAVVLLRLFGLVLRFCGLAFPRGRCAAAGVGVMTRARRLATCVVLGGAWFCFSWGVVPKRVVQLVVVGVGSRSQAGCLKRNTAMDDSIGGS